jgi:hypothetical protein
MDVRTRVKFAMCGGTSVKKNIGAGSEKRDENIWMFNRERIALFKRIIPN